ncbi:hypothetical protein EV426DRAFT_591012 [Tirmania nivea]|nr:hypothetical protein EV426DRAFT_591012 [Tirmania nivea]
MFLVMTILGHVIYWFVFIQLASLPFIKHEQARFKVHNVISIYTYEAFSPSNNSSIVTIFGNNCSCSQFKSLLAESIRISRGSSELSTCFWDALMAGDAEQTKVPSTYFWDPVDADTDVLNHYHT